MSQYVPPARKSHAKEESTAHGVEVFQCPHCGEWHPDERTADDCCDSPPERDDTWRAPPAPLAVHMTGLGYKYLRDRAGDADETVYVHQLVVIAAGADPATVFAPGIDVHHRNHIPWDNPPANLELEESKVHRRGHLDGRDPSEVDA